MNRKELRQKVRKLMKKHKVTKRDVKGNSYKGIYETLTKEN